MVLEKRQGLSVVTFLVTVYEMIVCARIRCEVKAEKAFVAVKGRKGV